MPPYYVFTDLFEFKLKFLVAGEIRWKQRIAGGNKEAAGGSKIFIVQFAIELLNKSIWHQQDKKKSSVF